jgi:hypothetical protein
MFQPESLVNGINQIAAVAPHVRRAQQYLHQHPILLVLFIFNLGNLSQGGQELTLIEGNFQANSPKPLTNALLHSTQETIQALTRSSRHVHSVPLSPASDRRSLRELVGLVVDLQDGNIVGSNLSQDLVHRLPELRPIGMGYIDDMQQEI